MAIVEIDYVKTYLGITGSSLDPQLQIWIDQANAIVCRYCDREFEYAAYPSASLTGSGDSGYYEGPVGRILALRQYPVIAITSIYRDFTGWWGQNPDSPFAAATLLTAGIDYALKLDGCLPGTSTRCSESGHVFSLTGGWGGRLIHRHGWVTPTFGLGLGNLKVAYTAGYTADQMPEDLKAACCSIIAWIRRNYDKGGPLQSESQGAYSYSLGSASSADFPEIGTVRQTLAKWRRKYG